MRERTTSAHPVSGEEHVDGARRAVAPVHELVGPGSLGGREEVAALVAAAEQEVHSGPDQVLQVVLLVPRPATGGGRRRSSSSSTRGGRRGRRRGHEAVRAVQEVRPRRLHEHLEDAAKAVRGAEVFCAVPLEHKRRQRRLRELRRERALAAGALRGHLLRELLRAQYAGLDHRAVERFDARVELREQLRRQSGAQQVRLRVRVVRAQQQERVEEPHAAVKELVAQVGICGNASRHRNGLKNPGIRIDKRRQWYEYSSVVILVNKSKSSA